MVSFLHMRIGLDFDGVLSDCGALKSECALELFGVRIPAERFKKEIVLGEGLLSAEQYRDLQERIYGTRELGLRMAPVPGVLDVLPRIMADGHEVTIITSRSGDMLAIATEWCAAHGLTPEFRGVGYGVSKAGEARGLHVYVDDDLDKIAPLVGVVPHRFLFSWGYNAHEEPEGIAERVASWHELHRRISDLSGPGEV